MTHFLIMKRCSSCHRMKVSRTCPVSSLSFRLSLFPCKSSCHNHMASLYFFPFLNKVPSFLCMVCQDLLDLSQHLSTCCTVYQVIPIVRLLYLPGSSPLLLPSPVPSCTTVVASYVHRPLFGEFLPRLLCRLFLGPLSLLPSNRD